MASSARPGPCAASRPAETSSCTSTRGWAPEDCRWARSGAGSVTVPDPTRSHAGGLRPPSRRHYWQYQKGSLPNGSCQCQWPQTQAGQQPEVPLSATVALADSRLAAS